jgi:hypothetical protein
MRRTTGARRHDGMRRTTGARRHDRMLSLGTRFADCFLGGGKAGSVHTPPDPSPKRRRGVHAVGGPGTRMQGAERRGTS